ncbi:hypothetical protein SAMN04487967_3254 [Natronorubrum sediminis]|uniref:Uncharacterized protein n=1 Tax=Natronorubrum sediminis TaxID=640943 RepID=A0A1H6G4N7_9EURY|nr:hypothetical protein SAMN04487967_3254 [Natronorubrum sediminis]
MTCNQLSGPNQCAAILEWKVRYGPPIEPLRFNWRRTDGWAMNLETNEREE